MGKEDVVKIFNLGNSMSFQNSSQLKPIPEKSSLPVRWTAPEVLAGKRKIELLIPSLIIKLDLASIAML